MAVIHSETLSVTLSSLVKGNQKRSTKVAPLLTDEHVSQFEELLSEILKGNEAHPNIVVEVERDNRPTLSE